MSRPMPSGGESTDAVAPEPPSGLIGMLFIDVEGSTRLATELGDGWGDVLQTYHAIVHGVMATTGGWVDSSAGDGFFITFGEVANAGRAAVAIQRALHAQPWPDTVKELRARMGLHIGRVSYQQHGYVGLEIHRAARVGAAAHGGQLLMTGIAAELLPELPSQPLGAHRLKDFPAPTALFCAVIDGRGAAAFQPPRTLELRAGSLPAAPGRLIGREHDLARVCAVLLDDRERLVTLLGRGGVGKTTLALACAHELIEEHPGGVWWVDAVHERDLAGLWSALARECRVSSEGPTPAAVIADLGARGPLLLVLDNLERIPDVRSLLDPLLAGLPEVRVLATSQLPTRSSYERRLRLDSLDEAEALALLTQTANRLDVALDDDGACVELVGLLDGLPLAIELAAARLRLFPASELLSRLRQSPSILQDRSRPERHRSLTAALDWTLELLDDEARELFVRLGVFAGPVEIDDLEAVTGTGLDVVSAVDTLLEAALLRRVETGDGVVRFGFAEAVRQQASQRLDSAGGQEWRRSHAVWQRDLVWPLRIYEIGEARSVQRAHGSAAETQTALEWAWDHDRPLAREIALGRFSLASRAGAGLEATALLARVASDPGDNAGVTELVRENEAMAAASTAGASGVASRLLALFRELTDLYARFLCATNITIVLTWDERYEEALTWSDVALELAREISPLAENDTLMVRADTLLEAGWIEEAEAAIQAAEAAVGPLRPARQDLHEVNRAHLASVRGAHAEALDIHARILANAELAGDGSGIEMTMVSLLRALARAGREREMLETAGMLRAIADESEHRPVVPHVFAESEPAVPEALARLGPEGEAIFQAGRDVEPSRRVKRLCGLIYAS